jgi:hypothetical protein
VGLSPLYCGHFWLIVPAPDDRWGWLWRNWWNEDWKGKPKYSEKPCPSATLSTTNPTWQDPGSNPGRRVGKPATNRFSYGAALTQKLYSDTCTSSLLDSLSVFEQILGPFTSCSTCFSWSPPDLSSTKFSFQLINFTIKIQRLLFQATTCYQPNVFTFIPHWQI